jgi:hypothetical protein
MNGKKTWPGPTNQDGWVERFIQCRLREIDLEELPPEEADFVAAVEFASVSLPGVLEESILEFGLEQTSPASISRLAAASTADRETAYEQVIKAIDEGKNFVSLESEGRYIDVLSILSADGPVAPLYQDAYNFIVEKEGQDAQAVGPYGGIYLSLEELKTMVLSCDAEARTIRLYHT